MKIVSGILILITVYLSFTHGYSGIRNKMNPEEAKMISDLGINNSLLKIISVLNLVVALMILFPQTFFIANIINAAMILMIMILSLKSGNFKTALIEIPFLLMPLALIYLGHPLKKVTVS